MGPRTLLIVLAGLLGATASASAAEPATPAAAIVGYLNAQRAAQGIPAAIVEDPVLSEGCTLHNAYGQLNDVVTHGEDPALPGYTPAGDQAGRTSVLYAWVPRPWSAENNPFEHAPSHLHQLLAPRLDRMGAAEEGSRGCATTIASRNRPAPASPVTYSYPGDGAAGWREEEVAEEVPATPGERIGIPQGTVTGPYLYVMFDGPDQMPWDTASVTGASLTGPDGPVAIATIDNHTPGMETYLPPGAQVIPREPLRRGATYRVSVAADVTTRGRSGPLQGFRRSWSFTTRASDRERPTAATGPGVTVAEPLAGDGSQADAKTFAPEGLGAPRVAGVTPQPVSRRRRWPFVVSAPARVPARRSVTITVTCGSRLSLRFFRLSAFKGLTLRRRAAVAVRGDTWTFRVRVPAPFDRSGQRVRLTMVLAAGGRQRYVVRRIVRFSDPLPR